MICTQITSMVKGRKTTHTELDLLQLVETKKHFLEILPYINYIKLKYGPEVWSGNNFMNISNEPNHGCVI